MNVSLNLQSVKQSLPPEVVLVAVSKTHPPEIILEAYEAGHRDFGENKVQEMISKAGVLPGDIRWHLIGHLQRNKVKYIAEFVHMIHSVDSLKLLKEIEKRASDAGRIIECLLQVHIAREESKFGLDEGGCEEILRDESFREMKHIRIRGLMGMATFTDDERQIREEFASLRKLFERLKNTFPVDDRWQPELLSMGMSSDFRIAVREGSNMVRVGSLIFGDRTYG